MKDADGGRVFIDRGAMSSKSNYLAGLTAKELNREKKLNFSELQIRDLDRELRTR